MIAVPFSATLFVQLRECIQLGKFTCDPVERHSENGSSMRSVRRHISTFSLNSHYPTLFFAVDGSTAITLLSCLVGFDSKEPVFGFVGGMKRTNCFATAGRKVSKRFSVSEDFDRTSEVSHGFQR